MTAEVEMSERFARTLLADPYSYLYLFKCYRGNKYLRRHLWKKKTKTKINLVVLVNENNNNNLFGEAASTCLEFFENLLVVSLVLV